MRLFLQFVFVIAVTAAVYAFTGSPLMVKEEVRRRMEIASVAPHIAELEAALKDDPKNLAMTALLGQLYMETGQYRASAEAYRRAVLLSDGDPMLILQYNKALVFASDGEVSEKAREGFALVRTLEPGNPEARYFLALYDLQQGNLEQAMTAMKALYKELPDGSPLKNVMNRQIGRE